MSSDAPSAPPLAAYVRRVVVAKLDETVASAARRLRDERVGCLVITRQGRPIGILTDRDLAVRVVAEARDPNATLVSDVLTYDPFTLPAGETVEAVARCMQTHGIRRVPIVDDHGSIAGIVTADDILVDLGRQLSAVGEALAEGADATESR